jgi:serine/threonine-protein kinase RsbW
VAEGEVRLAVPAQPEYLRMTRILAAGVASRIGFTLDEVDDLRIAIDEVCFSLVGPSGRDGTVNVRYQILPDGLLVEGEGHFVDGSQHQPLLSPLSMQILRAVTDECDLETGLDGPTFRLLKRRRLGSAERGS